MMQVWSTSIFLSFEMKHFVIQNIVLFLDPTPSLGVRMTIRMLIIRTYINDASLQKHQPFYPSKMKHFVN